MTLPLLRQRLICLMIKMTIVKIKTKKEIGCLYGTTPVETENAVCGKKMTKVEIMTRKNNLDA